MFFAVIWLIQQTENLFRPKSCGEVQKSPWKYWWKIWIGFLENGQLFRGIFVTFASPRNIFFGPESKKLIFILTQNLVGFNFKTDLAHPIWTASGKKNLPNFYFLFIFLSLKLIGRINLKDKKINKKCRNSQVFFHVGQRSPWEWKVPRPNLAYTKGLTICGHVCTNLVTRENRFCGWKFQLETSGRLFLNTNILGSYQFDLFCTSTGLLQFGISTLFSNLEKKKLENCSKFLYKILPPKWFFKPRVSYHFKA